MIALALIGVLLDRRGLSLRSVAWAAMVILVIQPESVLGASFQMSFAAVIALIAGYEYLSERRAYGDGDGWNRHSGWWQPSLRYLAGIAITTLIAGAATAPFAVFHFNRFADYGLIANLIAVPLTGLWVMPSAMLAFLLMPFGAEAWALAPMGWGLELVIQSAKAVAAWPGAVTLMPAMPVWGLVLISLGGLWLCLWRWVWRLWGLAVIAAGFSAMIWVEPPQILIDGAGRVLAIKADDGRMLVSQRRRGRFQQEIWARLSGLEHRPGLMPASGRSADGRLNCDVESCLYQESGLTASLIRSESAFDEDCWIADIIVSMSPLRKRCPSAKVIDRYDLWRLGGHAIWMSNAGIRIETVNGYRGERPWVPKKASAKKQNATPMKRSKPHSAATSIVAHQPD